MILYEKINKVYEKEIRNLLVEFFGEYELLMDPLTIARFVDALNKTTVDFSDALFNKDMEYISHFMGEYEIMEAELEAAENKVDSEIEQAQETGE
jgi:hypothetical protein